MTPNCTLKFYNPADTLVHTLESGAISVITHAGLNEDIGFFTIQLPTKFGATYKYYDIASNWTMKAWFSNITIDTAQLPQFAGKVYQTTTSNLPQGYTRQITGKTLGEVLQRRIKMRRVYTALDASTIVAVDIATELGIYEVSGDKIVADTTALTLTVDAESYLDLLKRVSDYWTVGGSVQKDFHVDVEGHLMWKGRPHRTAVTNVMGTADAGGDTDNTIDAERTEANDYWNGCYITFTSGTNIGLTRLIMDFDSGTDTFHHMAFPAVVDAGDTYTIIGVETLTLGTDILSYNVVRDGTQIKNHIQVYGRKVPFVGVNDANNKFLAYQIFGRKDPVDGDTYTDDAGWTDIKGVTSSANAAPVPQVGADYTRSDSEDVNNDCEFHRHFTSYISCEGYDGYGALEFWTFRNSMGNGYIRLYCDDSSNYYQAGPFDLGLVNDTWLFHRFSLGMANTYNATTNPTGEWTATGSPDWEHIYGIEVQGWSATRDSYMGIDGLCFNFGRWRYLAEDGTSQSDYEQHDSVVVNDLLNSDAECESHSKTLIYQQKDPVIRLDLVLIGNTNVLLSDQIPITIPAENFSAKNFFVTSVEQHWGNAPEGWRTVVTSVDTLNTRNVPAASDRDVILKELKRQRDIGKGRLSKIT